MSTLKVTNIQATGETASRAVSGVAAAWCKINSTITNIDGSFNVSSLNDDGTGDGGVNLISAMSSSDYVTVASTISASSSAIMTVDYDGTQSASSFEFEVAYGNLSTGRTAIDRTTFHSVHGDLA